MKSVCLHTSIDLTTCMTEYIHINTTNIQYAFFVKSDKLTLKKYTISISYREVGTCKARRDLFMMFIYYVGIKLQFT